MYAILTDNGSLVPRDILSNEKNTNMSKITSGCGQMEKCYEIQFSCKITNTLYHIENILFNCICGVNAFLSEIKLPKKNVV